MLLVLARFLMVTLPLLEVLVEPLTSSSSREKNSAQDDHRCGHRSHASEPGGNNELA
jgi:hypothetical protein